jgi:aminoglycoside 6-adenylyltransferase
VLREIEMRSEEEIFNLVLNIAKSESRIRAVLLNGSRANPKAKKDKFQDFDIVYVVNNIDSFLSNHTWIDIFGERLILQMPEEMTIGESNYNKNPSFSYLMLFKDGVRIDLTLFPVSKLQSEFERDSLTIILLDKDNLFSNLPSSSESDYLIKQPTETEFTECCNEFWWVSAYVAKALYREEIILAKDLLENPVRSMFLKIIEWVIGLKTNFSASFGKSGRNIKEYVSSGLYKKILSTYPDSKIENIWEALFKMTEIFGELAKEIKIVLNFKYNLEEELNIKQYLRWIRSLSKQDKIVEGRKAH